MAGGPSVFLGLGSNVGDREANLRAALRGLEAPPQEWFLNAVAGGETLLSPEALLHPCLETERRCPDRSQVVLNERGLPR